jgi:hypothetical protein
LSASITGRPTTSVLSRTEEATGFKPLLLPKAAIGHRQAAGGQRRADTLPRCLSGAIHR